MKTPFEMLGLPLTATPEEVKRRWRELCSTLHPDRPGGNAVAFDEARRAYKAAYAEAAEPKPCPKCKKTGRIMQGGGFNTVSLTCPQCGGAGTL